MRDFAQSLLVTLGNQFKLDANSLAVHELPSGEARQFPHGRFRGHRPYWAC